MDLGHLLAQFPMTTGLVCVDPSLDPHLFTHLFLTLFHLRGTRFKQSGMFFITGIFFLDVTFFNVLFGIDFLFLLTEPYV